MLIQSWIKVKFCSLLWLTLQIRAGISISHLSIPGIVADGRFYISYQIKVSFFSNLWFCSSIKSLLLLLWLLLLFLLIISISIIIIIFYMFCFAIISHFHCFVMSRYHCYYCFHRHLYQFFNSLFIFTFFFIIIIIIIIIILVLFFLFTSD